MKIAKGETDQKAAPGLGADRRQEMAKPRDIEKKKGLYCIAYLF